MKLRSAMPVTLVFCAVAALAGVGALLAEELLREQRDLLIKNLESDMTTSVTSLAGLVSERARYIRSDLLTAAEVVTQQRAAKGLSLDLVRAHLIALDRSTKHYCKLWHLRAGEVITEVGGFRDTEIPVPEILPESLMRVVGKASTHPGTVASEIPETIQPTQYQRLQLFALANRPDKRSHCCSRQHGCAL
ncbi:MAG: hypothetical protein R3C68_12160 [Myxococcota bacterium]